MLQHLANKKVHELTEEDWVLIREMKTKVRRRKLYLNRDDNLQALPEKTRKHKAAKADPNEPIPDLIG